MFSPEHTGTGAACPQFWFKGERTMSSTFRLLAAAALLGALTGCAMPNWSTTAPADSLQNPAIYHAPADG